jgi:uncharacterized protein YeaO (DUF488 family)
MTEIRLARVYDAPSPADGFRVLVDRLWPRGISKERLPLDLWATDVAPSAELRTWFHHDPERFEEFAARYRAELAAGSGLDALATVCKANPVVTLLFAAKDPAVNQAVVLREALLERLK